ncbi:DMT family transporter, partial [Streptomonospora algeriensis]
MIVWSVLIAVAGAFCLALGSALQERDAVRAPGRSVAPMGFLVHLARRPRWLAGTVGAGAGVVLHLVALSGAPLTIIQPIGVSGLVFAIMLSAFFNRRRVRPNQIVAGAAVMVGLTGLLLLFPHTAQTPQMSVGTALTLTGAVAALGGAAYAAAHWV